MIKTFFTLLKGNAANAEQNIIDRNAMTILDQQMRDGAQTLHQAKRSLAVANAQFKQQVDNIAKTDLQIADIEERVKQALQADCDGLAHEGAAAIAELEAEKNTSLSAQHLFEKEIKHLRNYVNQAEARIASLDRGRRVAKTTQAISSLRQGRIEVSSLFHSSLSEAEATLNRFRERSAETQSAEDEFDALESKSHISVAEKLGQEGFGTRLKTKADDVIARLKIQII